MWGSPYYPPHTVRGDRNLSNTKKTPKQWYFIMGWVVLVISFAILCSPGNFSATLFTKFLMNCSLANHLVLLKSDNFCLVLHPHIQCHPDFRYLASEPLLGSYWNLGDIQLGRSHTVTWTIYPSTHFSAIFPWSYGEMLIAQSLSIFFLILPTTSLWNPALLLGPLHYFPVVTSAVF